MGKSSTTEQKNSPPDWAKPLLTKGAADAMKLYDEGKGYNTYTGPTQAQFSPTTLQGMNSLLAATGGGAPITNEGVFNNPAIQQARQQLAAQAAQNAQQPQGQQTGQGVWIQQSDTQKLGGGRGGGTMAMPYYVNSITGEHLTPQQYTKQQRESGGGLW